MGSAACKKQPLDQPKHIYFHQVLHFILTTMKKAFCLNTEIAPVQETQDHTQNSRKQMRKAVLYIPQTSCSCFSLS